MSLHRSRFRSSEAMPESPEKSKAVLCLRKRCRAALGLPSASGLVEQALMMLTRAVMRLCTAAEVSAMPAAIPEWIDDQLIHDVWQGRQPERPGNQPSSSGAAPAEQPADEADADKLPAMSASRLRDRGCDRYLKHNRARLREEADVRRLPARLKTQEQRIKHLGRLEWNRMCFDERKPFLEEAAAGPTRHRNPVTGAFESEPCSRQAAVEPGTFNTSLKRKDFAKLGEALVEVVQQSASKRGRLDSTAKALVTATMKTAGFSRKKSEPDSIDSHELENVEKNRHS